MDYSGFREFPFPSGVSEAERVLKAYFMALPDDGQLALLNGCTCYEEFLDRVSASAHSAWSDCPR